MILIGIDFTEKKLTHSEEHAAGCRLRDDILRLIAPNEEFQFAKHDIGKPYIAFSDVSFSISHTDGCVACAVCAELTAEEIKELPRVVTESGLYKLPSHFPSEIGLDAELADRERSDDRISSIAARYFSAGERARLESADDRAMEFYSIWTAKESFVKCTGDGMKAIAATDTEGLEEKFVIHEFTLRNGGTEYAAAVCLMRK